ncbi:MAG: hypothetical protein O7C98_00820 [Planctomycetota bacterium]|nr:hypothetical protein [Planctomycetota bacterium]
MLTTWINEEWGYFAGMVVHRDPDGIEASTGCREPICWRCRTKLDEKAAFLAQFRHKVG